MKNNAFAKFRNSRPVWRLVAGVLLLALIAVPIVGTVNASSPPTITILSVNVDKSVSVRMDHFPANTMFYVKMGAYGSAGQVTTEFGSGEGGTFTATFTIPANLKGLKTLFIRVDSKTGGYSAYNHFTNNTEMVVVPTPQPPVTVGTPSFIIQDVAKDSQVSIKTFNFPANVQFQVLMGAYGTLGIGGVEVTQFGSGEGGTFTATFNIPNSLKGSYRIAIRLQALSGGYYAYNWFENDPTAVPTPGPVTPVVPGYVGVPTFEISSVETGLKVTILTKNFPPNYDFTVRMGAYGTLGVGGTVVGTFNTGTGGAFSKTFDIPDGLKTAEKIAIRADSSKGGFYAYNWFVNKPAVVVTPTTTPGGPTPTPVPTAIPGYRGYPTFYISAVEKDVSVTVRAYNLPPNQTFAVKMGAYGTRGIGGTLVTSFDSGAGGTQDFTFAIPSGLKGSQRIAIRMDCSLGYYAFNWFWNNSTN